MPKPTKPTTLNVVDARTGDLVRAARDERDRDPVEGVLHLIYVPTLDYVQVNLLTPERMFAVDPESVVVVQRAVVDQDELDAGLPVRIDRGWEPSRSLADAVRRGLVTPFRQRPGGTWSNMHADLRAVLAGMLAAGWTITESGQESFPDGDMVYVGLERGGTSLEVQRNEAGWVDVYRGEPSPDPDDPLPPLLVLDNPTAEQLAAEVDALGPIMPLATEGG